MLKLVVILLTLFFSVKASAVVTESQYPYDPTKPLKMGNGIDLSNFGEAKIECLTYETEFETEGNNEVKAEINIITTYEKLSNTLNLSKSRKLTADVSWTSYKANGEFSSNYKYSDFKKNENSSIFIVANVFTDWGKKVAKNYKLKNNLKTLIDNNEFEKFKKS